MTGTSITKADWETVKRFFSQHPKTIKALYQDSVSKILRTFIRFKSTIVALGKELGQGAFGVVNYAQDEQNREFAVKTENGEINQSDIEELFIAQDLDYAYGITDHQVGTKKEKFKLLKYLDGVDLAFEIYDKYKYFNDHKMEKLNKLTYVQRLIIAIKVCLRLKELQKHRIIHADLKPENIKVKVNGNNIEVYLMDFGFSMRLPSGSTTKIDGCKGTPGYIAPEIYNQAFPSYSQMIFSFESDIYAIGA
ncbi:MAG: protein kinase, partial [Candidatus Berkiella sp.]